MQCVYLGNFVPEHSTENHVLQALRTNSHTVRTMQENDPTTFLSMASDHFDWGQTQMVLWTRTGWDWNRILRGGEAQAHRHQRAMLEQASARNIPVVGYHLDIWWGLNREHQVSTEPFFESTLMVTADGGHDAEWASVGVDHAWLPPAVATAQAKCGNHRGQFISDLAFVGSWQAGYHPESAHRHALVDWLQKNFPKQCAFYPRRGEQPIRGALLADLYRSTKIVIGDSCFTGTGLANYWSDRIPETLGRGGLLLHPNVPGMERFFTDGMDLLTWDAGDFDALGALIERTLVDGLQRENIQRQGRRTVLEGHTYEIRMQQLMTILQERNLL